MVWGMSTKPLSSSPEDYDKLYALVLNDPKAFWAERAKAFEWTKPFGHVLAGDPPYERWFEGGVTNITLNAIDRHVKAGLSDTTAYIFLDERGNERTYTYGELLDAVGRFGAGLKGLGVQKGDRVCIYMPMVPEAFVAILACARIGAVHSVVYAGLGKEALFSRIADAKASCLITADVGYRRGKEVPLKEIATEALHRATGVRNVIVLRRKGEGTRLNTNEQDFQSLISESQAPCPPEPMESEDPLFILYTSGTTGPPKGVVYANAGYMVGVPTMFELATHVQRGEVFFCTSDIGWIVGHSLQVYGPLLLGITSVIREGTPDWPDPGVLWRVIERYRINVLYTAPTAVRMFVKYGPEWPERYNTESLRLTVSAGEVMNPQAWEWFTEHVGKGRIPLLDNWWQTETAAPTIGIPPGYPAKPGKAGKPFPGVQADVVDDSGRSLGPNEPGNLVLKDSGPHRFRGIFGNPERFERYFKAIPGFYACSDAAMKDEERYIQILGRNDDILNVAGHRIGTAEVENALMEHELVAEAAVVGIPDELKGEAIEALVVLKQGALPSEDLALRLIRHVRETLGPIASPSEVRFMERFPKTRSGKVMRRILKAQLVGGDLGDTSTLED
jgi:acetyl-CoA synthetase